MGPAPRSDKANKRGSFFSTNTMMAMRQEWSVRPHRRRRRRPCDAMPFCAGAPSRALRAARSLIERSNDEAAYGLNALALWKVRGRARSAPARARTQRGVSGPQDLDELKELPVDLREMRKYAIYEGARGAAGGCSTRSPSG
jgi:hypothetical protein